MLQKVLRQVEYLIEVAMRDDEKGDVKEAEKLYTCAVEVALQAVGCEECILNVFGRFNYSFYPHPSPCKKRFGPEGGSLFL